VTFLPASLTHARAFRVKKYTTFAEVMENHGVRKTALGCEVCKVRMREQCLEIGGGPSLTRLPPLVPSLSQPCIGNILSSTVGISAHIMDAANHPLQTENDKFLGNIQRDGTFSVVPRMQGGEVTPDGLIACGMVAKKYGLYSKITGGQVRRVPSSQTWKRSGGPRPKRGGRLAVGRVPGEMYCLTRTSFSCFLSGSTSLAPRSKTCPPSGPSSVPPASSRVMRTASRCGP